MLKDFSQWEALELNRAGSYLTQVKRLLEPLSGDSNSKDYYGFIFELSKSEALLEFLKVCLTDLF